MIDDFLPQRLFEEVRALLRLQDFVKLGDSDRWNKQWHMSSGPIYRSEAPFFQYTRPRKSASEATTMTDLHTQLQIAANTYPTGTAVDEYFAYVRRIVEAETELLPEFAERGNRISARFVIHPSGSGFRFHYDPECLGTYDFYAHDRWNCEWGGEHVAFEQQCPDLAEIQNEAAFDNTRMNDYVNTLGVGIAIMPKPNRIVFAAARRLQKIARVDVAAGHNLRLSVQGVFSETL